MAQIYPSPTIYTYRVKAWGRVQTDTTSPNKLPVNYVAEFSSNSGTTWAPADNQIFNSLQDAYQQIAQIVGSEAYFAANTAQIVAPVQIFPYPV